MKLCGMAGTAPSVADLALFAYTHRADEGEFDLARWPGVLAWVSRASALPGITVLPRPDQVVRPGQWGKGADADGLRDAPGTSHRSFGEGQAGHASLSFG